VTVEQERLFAAHAWLAFAIAGDYFLPDGEAADVRQEALIGLWRAAVSYDGVTGTFAGWARIVIRRRLDRMVRDHNARKHLVLTNAARDELVDDEQVPRIEQVAGPDTAEGWAEYREALARVVTVCSPAELHAVSRALVGLPCRRGTSEMNALARARRKLADESWAPREVGPRVPACVECGRPRSASDLSAETAERIAAGAPSVCRYCQAAARPPAGPDRRLRLTDTEVAEIRSRHAAGTSSTQLAREYGVTRTYVWMLATGRHREAA
jgi:RNA polymerase sigma factor (sigma-70 family)